MRHFRLLLVVLIILSDVQSALADAAVHLGEVRVPQEELKNLIPGQPYHHTLPDGSTMWGRIMGPEESPDHKISMWVDEVTPPGVAPSAGAGGQMGGGGSAASAPAPGRGAAAQGAGGSGSGGGGPSLGGALGMGALAGLGQIGIEAIYNGFVMTPAKRAAYEQAQRAYDASNTQLQAASNQLNHDFMIGMGEAAKALQVAQNSLNVPADWHPLSGPLPPGAEAKEALASAPAEYQAAAQPLFDQINSVQAQNLMQSNAQKIGNAAIESGALSAAGGDSELSRTYLGIAKQMANLLVGLDPITGTARFGYELFSGKNMITGEDLGSWERAFSGAAFAASLVTLGTSATMISAVKGCLGVMETIKGAGLVAGIASLRESKAITDTLRTMGWAEKEIATFSKFNRTILNGTVKDLDYSIYAYKNWTPAAKASFPKVMNDLKLSAEEMTKASKNFGVDAKVLLERRAKAIGFYNNTAGFEQNVQRIGNHLVGIDFGKSVDLVKVEAGTEVYAWHVTGADVGNYATRQATPAWKVGVGSLGRLEDGSIAAKEMATLEVTQDTFALETTANEINDTFSLKLPKGADIPKDQLKLKPFDIKPNGRRSNWLQYAPGGEKQLFLDMKSLRIKQ